MGHKSREHGLLGEFCSLFLRESGKGSGKKIGSDVVEYTIQGMLYGFFYIICKEQIYPET